MGRFYKKAIVTALLVSALSTTAFAAPEDVYTNIADSAVIMDGFISISIINYSFCGARRCIYKYC
ncbi:hypothetical protein [Megamonas funiformis]|uniref:hypothetical protein n=1 Tax=Megamonas funiformis TaxID=437897 RepID=UPI000AF5CC1C|nr:hypothetical protein [Megamonas funiformis]